MKVLTVMVITALTLFGSASATFFVPTAAAESAPADSNATVQTYTGVIINLNGQRFVLRDDANDTWYHLDDQEKAAQFLGKKVTVSGKLDPATDFIHVQQIQVQNG